MNTSRTQYEIEVAIAKMKEFDFRKNIIAYNVLGISAKLPIDHECDMLVLSKSGYLSEIEIKRSWSDFMADFKKKHRHEGMGLVNYFYYCIPHSLLDRAYDELYSRQVEYSGIITYTEDLHMRIYGYRYDKLDGTYGSLIRYTRGRKLFLEEQLEVARYGAMRSVMLKEKLSKI